MRFYRHAHYFAVFHLNTPLRAQKTPLPHQQEKTLLKIPHSPSAIESCPRPGLGQGQESVDNVNSVPKQHSRSDFIETGGMYLDFDTLKERKFPHGNFRTTRVLHSQNTDCRKNDSSSTVSYRPNDFSAPYIPDGGRGIHPTNGASRGSRRGRRCASARPRFRGRPARRVRRSRPR